MSKLKEAYGASTSMTLNEPELSRPTTLGPEKVVLGTHSTAKSSDYM
jgi:hypothetical protein